MELYPMPHENDEIITFIILFLEMYIPMNVNNGNPKVINGVVSKSKNDVNAPIPKNKSI